MIISVGSFEEAKNYPVLFNSNELMIDSTKDVFYVKAVDSMGKYDMSTYRFERIENEQPLTAENFVTKQQFDALTNKLDQMIQVMLTQQQTQDTLTQGGSNNGQLDSEQQQSVHVNQRSSKSR